MRRGKPIVMGGFHDGVSARLAEKAGFPLAFMGGYAVAASLLGEPDIGLLTQAEMADAARRLCRLVSMPVRMESEDVITPCPLKPGTYEYRIDLFTGVTGGGFDGFDNSLRTLPGKLVVE